MKKSLAIVIPVYRSTASVAELIHKIKETFRDVCTYRIFLVDDGNTDDVKEYLVEHCLEDAVTLVVLEKNYGQQNAVLCGLRMSTGYDYVATMDDDLAHSPTVLLRMYEKMAEGHDLVYAVPEEDRQYSFGSRMRDLLFRWALHCPEGKRVSSFRMMTAQVVREVAGRNYGFFYFSAAALRLFGNIENIRYVKQTEARKSGYNFRKRFSLFSRIVRHYVFGFGRNHAKEEEYRIKEIYPKLMVLGGGNCQLHALERAKQEGIYTVLADYTEAPPGAKVADRHEKISTFDADACLLAAKTHHVQGVMTMGTDQPVLTAAIVSEAMGLPSCLSTEQALYVTNKKYMKQRLAEAEIRTSPWMLVDEETTEEEIKQLTPPYVLKPLDSQGQRGIFKLNTAAEIKEHLTETLSFSRCREALLEEFYESDEITVSGYMDHGRLIIFTITDRLLYPDPVHIGVCTGHRFPSVHIGDYEEIRTISEKIVAAFNLKNGPFYLQLLKGADGIRVNELACRIGGAFEDVVISYLTGFDFLGAVMQNAFGHPVDVRKYYDFRCDRLEKEAAVQLLFCHPGKIETVTPEKMLRELPYVLDCGYNYHEGDIIPAVQNATARFGHAVITGTKETIAEHISEFYNVLSVKSEGNTELVNRLYPER